MDSYGLWAQEADYHAAPTGAEAVLGAAQDVF